MISDLFLGRLCVEIVCGSNYSSFLLPVFIPFLFISPDHLFFSGYQQTFLEVARQHSRDHHYRFDGEQ
jgi:hypothetical protein